MHFYPIFLKVCVKEVRYNYTAHLFIIDISSHSHKEWKQPQIIFVQYSCCITIINILKKYLRRKIHELNTLIGILMIHSHKHNKYIVKYCLLWNNYWQMLLLFCEVLPTKLPFSQKFTLFSQKLTLHSPYFFSF